MQRKGESAKGGREGSRRERLATELRANLLKRKELARERALREPRTADDAAQIRHAEPDATGSKD